MGRISTPIIVQKLEKKDNNFEYIVLEGNNRLTIYKELHKDEAEVKIMTKNGKNTLRDYRKHK